MYGSAADDDFDAVAVHGAVAGCAACIYCLYQRACIFDGLARHSSSYAGHADGLDRTCCKRSERCGRETATGKEYRLKRHLLSC